jgi:hypothetical protein
LDMLLNEHFGSDPYLAGALTSVIIPSFDIKIQQPVFFSSWKVHPLCLCPFLLPLFRHFLNDQTIERKP